jgi:hypothetical protein
VPNPRPIQSITVLRIVDPVMMPGTLEHWP